MCGLQNRQVIWRPLRHLACPRRGVNGPLPEHDVSLQSHRSRFERCGKVSLNCTRPKYPPWGTMRLLSLGAMATGSRCAPEVGGEGRGLTITSPQLRIHIRIITARRCCTFRWCRSCCLCEFSGLVTRPLRVGARWHLLFIKGFEQPRPLLWQRKCLV